MGLLIGGHETSSTTIGWALYSLARHPHEQDLLREELIKAFPDKSKFNPTYDEINSLEYLNCVVKETLRIRPMSKNLKLLETLIYLIVSPTIYFFFYLSYFYVTI